jgi:hypothetical protein
MAWSRDSRLQVCSMVANRTDGAVLILSASSAVMVPQLPLRVVKSLTTTPCSGVIAPPSARKADTCPAVIYDTGALVAAERNKSALCEIHDLSVSGTYQSAYAGLPAPLGSWCSAYTGKRSNVSQCTGRTTAKCRRSRVAT